MLQNNLIIYDEIIPTGLPSFYRMHAIFEVYHQKIIWWSIFWLGMFVSELSLLNVKNGTYEEENLVQHIQNY